MADFKETMIECLDVDKYATFCSAERRWINRINKLHEQYPDEVQIVYAPEDNCGVIYAHIPKSWMKISPPKKTNMSEEQRVAAAERMRKAREARADKV